MLERFFKRSRATASNQASEPAAGPGGLGAPLNLALNHHREGRLLEAEAAYRDILGGDSQNVDAMHFLGVIAYQRGDLDEAERLIRAALARNGRNAPALNNLGNVLAQGNRPREAIDCYAAAAALQPDYIDAQVNLAAARARCGELEQSAADYERVLSLAPTSISVLCGLANVRARQERSAEAERLCRRALQLDARAASAHLLLGNVLHRRGVRDAAEASYREAIALQPDLTEAHCGLGEVLRENGRQDAAILCFARALEIDPGSPHAHGGLANALVEQGELDRAISAYRASLALAPDAPAVLSNLANVLLQKGRRDEAIASCRRALELDAEFAPALCNLGVALENDHLERAIACYRQALAADPDFALVHYKLGNALTKAGRHREAAEHFRSALARNAKLHEARWALAMCQLPAVPALDEDPRKSRTAFSEGLADLERWFAASAEPAAYQAVGAQQPFLLAYQEEDNRALLERFGRLCVDVMASWWLQQGFEKPAPRAARDTVRVAFVTGHFRGGSIWEAVVEGWLRNLDSRRFELHAFYVDEIEDEHTALARSAAASFVQGARGLRQWVQAILDAQLDAIVYPDIGLHPLTLKLASLRLAPLQVATWGHPQTTGLSTIDCYLSAEDMEPEGAEAHYSERLVNLPNLGTYYYPSTEHSIQQNATDRDVPILVCPGTPFKYAPQFDWIFPAIARELGQCRFLFFNFRAGEMSDMLRKRLQAVFSRSGLAFDDFATFLPWQSRGSFHDIMRGAAVYLDTIGYSGFNTAIQAVECGLPIVTRDGRYLRGRFAGGILRRLGLPELIASTEKEYVGLAVRMCKDPDFRERVRGRIEANRPLLFRDTAPVRALETFLVESVHKMAHS